MKLESSGGRGIQTAFYGQHYLLYTIVSLVYGNALKLEKGCIPGMKYAVITRTSHHPSLKNISIQYYLNQSFSQKEVSVFLYKQFNL